MGASNLALDCLFLKVFFHRFEDYFNFWRLGLLLPSLNQCFLMKAFVQAVFLNWLTSLPFSLCLWDLVCYLEFEWLDCNFQFSLRMLFLLNFLLYSYFIQYFLFSFYYCEGQFWACHCFDYFEILCLTLDVYLKKRIEVLAVSYDNCRASGINLPLMKNYCQIHVSYSYL